MIGNAKKNIGFDSNYYISSSLIAYNPTAIVADYSSRVVANGGRLSGTITTALTNFVTSLVNANLWGKMKYIYPFPWSDAASCAVNLVNSNYLATFSSGWTFTLLGATPSGANTYMTINGFNPKSLLNPYSTCWSYYSRTSNSTNGFELGIQNGFTITDRIAMSMYYTALNYSNMNNFNTSGQISNTATTTNGLYLMTRTSQNSQQFFRKGVQLGATNTNTMTTPLPDAIMRIATIYFNDGVSYISTNRQCSFSHCSDGLTQSQAVSFDSYVQTLQTALSRAV